MKQKKELKIRRADMNDAEFLFRLRNDPDARKFFLNPTEVQWEEHRSWLKNALISKKSVLYVVRNSENTLCGQVRFDITGENKAEISITVDPIMRGQGLGGKIIEEGIKRFHQEYPDYKIIIAYIKPSNIPSRKVFKRSGFQFHEIETIKNVQAEEWIYEIE